MISFQSRQIGGPSWFKTPISSDGIGFTVFCLWLTAATIKFQGIDSEDCTYFRTLNSRESEKVKRIRAKPIFEGAGLCCSWFRLWALVLWRKFTTCAMVPIVPQIEKHQDFVKILLMCASALFLHLFCISKSELSKHHIKGLLRKYFCGFGQVHNGFLNSLSNCCAALRSSIFNFVHFNSKK